MFAIRYSPEGIKSENQIYQKLKEGGGTNFWKSLLEWYKFTPRVKEPVFNNVPAYIEDWAIQLSLIPERNLTEILVLLEELEEQTVKTKWITAEIDKITALIYFIITISVFIFAIIVLPNVLHGFAKEFGDTFLVRLGVVVFSALALSAVWVMLRHRIRGLLDKASIVFKYLTALGAIKIEKDKFKENLQEIEGYLNSGDWTLAEYWLNQIQIEYAEVFWSRVSMSDVKESNTGGIPSHIR
jgi:hypothetical protein